MHTNFFFSSFPELSVSTNEANINNDRKEKKVMISCDDFSTI